jgi:hypothetical protein
MATLLASLLAAAGASHFAVKAAFVPARGRAPAAVQVFFSPTDPDVRVNEEPAPRLHLSPDQKVLVDRQPPPSRATFAFDPETARYLDPAVPVVFPVALAPSAPRGTHAATGRVVYFYCSKREGWCRKGGVDVEVEVTVP